MSLGENFCFDESASIAFDRSNEKWAKPNPILQAERGNKSVYSRKVSSFSVGIMKSLHGNDEIFTSFR